MRWENRLLASGVDSRLAEGMDYARVFRAWRSRDRQVNSIFSPEIVKDFHICEVLFLCHTCSILAL